MLRPNVSPPIPFLLALLPALAVAQGGADQDVLEEVVVTAEKRESTVQDTPISITAFTGEALAAAGITSTESLANFTPGLTVQREVIGKVVIRGIGTENFTIGSDPGVAIHKEGAYIARSSVAIFDLFDVDRVEVLRGPQGTLYGRNATGGVINIVSREPEAEFGGYAKVDFGNYARRRFEGALNAPLGNAVRARLSVLYAERDGYTENLFPGAGARGLDELDDQDLWGVRGQLEFDLSEAAALLLQAEALRDDSNPVAFKYFQQPLPWQNAMDLTLPDLRQVSQGFETAIPGSGRTVPDISQADQTSFSARLTWDLGGARFSSLTAYREIDFSWINDGDGVDQFFVNYFQTDESEQVTQEFQLTSAGESRLQWLIGAFYLQEDAEMFNGIPFIIPIPTPFILWDAESETEAYAVFAQGTYDFTDRLRGTLGVRYNNEDKKGDFVYNLFGGILPPPGPPGTRFSDILDDSWDAVTPKLGVDFDFTDDVMGYLSVTRGFKSGGFNFIALQGPYDPEYVWDYEIGLKTRSAGGRLIANFGAFYYDYKDLQVGKVVNLSASVVNAAQATIKGVEAELRAVPGEGFEVSAGLAWLDTEYDEFVTEDPGYTGDPAAPGALGCGTPVSLAPPAQPNRSVSLAGCELPRAPELQGALGVSWSRQLAGGGELRLRGDYIHRGDQFFTQFNRNVVGQDAYDLLNARVSFTAPDERWSVTLYGDNLTDEEYFSTVLESGVASPGTVVPQAVLGPPRTYGLVVNYNF
jgi:iron complex outermembrane receptor protein